MSWDQDISKKISQLEQAVVRFDIEQKLTNTQKQTARTNIDIELSTATLISDNNYKITIS